MDQQGPGRRPAMDTGRAPAVVLSGPPEPRPRLADGLLDSEKTGAALLLSGVFIALVGITFTTMGWQRYPAGPGFEWPQLLGPVLISVGGTFVLTSVCKFGVASCWRRWRWDEEVLVVEQTTTGASFTLSQPITLRGTGGGTAMLCIPPPYSFIAQELNQAADLQPASSVAVAPPPPDAASCSADNAMTREAEDSSDVRSSRAEKTEDEGGRGEEGGPPRSRPPAYEDLYPTSSSHGVT